VAANSVAGWDGERWHAMGTMPSGSVEALTVWNGELVAAIGAGVRRWDGSAWQQLGQNFTGGSGDVWALTVYNGELIATGNFTEYVGLPVKNLARWTGSTWLPFAGGLAGTNATGRSMVVHNGQLIVGGNFSQAGTVPAGAIAAWDGTSWSDLAGGVSPLTNAIYALASHNGDLFAGGQFTSAGGIPCNKVARWDGTAWSAIGSNPTINSTVLAMASFNGDVVIGGSFAMIGAQPIARVARFDGASWTQVGPTLSTSTGGEVVNTITVHQGALHVGGFFTGQSGGPAASCVARFDKTWWQALTNGFDGQVRTAAPMDGALIVCGNFFAIDQVPIRGPARWTGGAWAPVSDVQLNGAIHAMLVEDDALIVGGWFTNVGERVARWEAGQWQPFGTGLPDTVNALVRFNGDLIAAGQPVPVGPTSVWRWDGASWSTLGASFNGPINALAVYEGELYAAGSFTSPAGRIARWTGAAWAGLGSGLNDVVFALRVFDDELVVGGAFTVAGGGTARRIARWSGSVWQPFAQDFTFPSNALVHGLGTHKGHLIATGNFTAPTPGYVAHWTGSSWAPLGAGLFGSSALSPSGYCVAEFNDEIIVGGRFHSAEGASGVPSAFLARWADIDLAWIAQEPEDAIVTAGDPAVLSIAVAPGYGELSYQWRRNGEPLPAGTECYVGEDSPTLLIHQAKAIDQGVYDCVVFNDCGTRTSEEASLVVVGTGGCSADFDCTGIVDGADLGVLLGQWGRCVHCASCAGDLTGDCVVDGADLGILLGAWGACDA